MDFWRIKTRLARAAERLLTCLPSTHSITRASGLRPRKKDMPDRAEPALCQFDRFLLDKQSGMLFRLHPDGRHKTPVQLGFRAVQILCLLVDRRGELVSHDEIMDAVWPNVAVQPSNLNVQVAALRRVMDAERGQGCSCIQNVPGRGYRFVPTVTPASPALLTLAGQTQAAGDEDPGTPGLG